MNVLRSLPEALDPAVLKANHAVLDFVEEGELACREGCAVWDVFDDDVGVFNHLPRVVAVRKEGIRVLAEEIPEPHHEAQQVGSVLPVPLHFFLDFFAQLFVFRGSIHRQHPRNIQEEIGDTGLRGLAARSGVVHDSRG